MKLNDYMSAAPHSAAFNVTGSNKVTQTSTFLFFFSLTPHIYLILATLLTVIVASLEVKKLFVWGFRSPPAERFLMLTFFCLKTGLQLQHRVQQHHSSLPAYGRQHPEQRSSQRSERLRANQNLDQTLWLRESEDNDGSSCPPLPFKEAIICPNSHIPAANSRFHFLHAGVHRGHHTGNAGRWDAGVLRHGPHTRQRGVDWDSDWFFCVLWYSSFTELRRKHFDNRVDITELVLTCLFLCFLFFFLRLNAGPLCASLVWYHRLTGVARQLWTFPSATSSSPAWRWFCSRCTPKTCWLPVTSLLWSVLLLRTSSDLLNKTVETLTTSSS